MSEAANTQSDKTYLPAEASLLATSVVCLAIAAVLAWVAVGISVPPQLFDFVCNLLLTGRHEPFRHFTVLSLSQKAIVALGAALFFAIGAFRLEALFGLPRLALTKDGIELRTLFGTKRAGWASLGAFEVITYRNRRNARADLVGPAASKSLLFGKTFTIPDAFSTNLDEIVRDINAARAQALGLSAKLAAEDAPSSGSLGSTLIFAAGAFVAVVLSVFAATHR